MKNITETTIMIQKGRILLPQVEDSPVNKNSINLVWGFLKNIETLGFTLDYRAIDIMQRMPENEIIELYNNIMPELEHFKGNDVEYKPMYPGFPEQVMKMDDCEFYLNAFMHYLTNGEYVPKYPEEELKNALNDKTKFPSLNLQKNKLSTLIACSLSDFKKSMQETITMRGAMSDTDRKYVNYFFEKYINKDISLLPDKIPYKENAIYIAKLLNDNQLGGLISKYITTPTDVVRFALYLSGKSIDFSDYSTKRGEHNFNNKILSKYGDLFMNLIDKNPSEEDFCVHKKELKSLTRLIHYNAKKNGYEREYPKAYHLIDRCHKNELKSLESKIETAKQNKNYKKMIDLYLIKPGKMIQNLDSIINIVPKSDKPYLLEQLSSDKIIKNVSPTLLYKTISHFTNRLEEKKYRRFAFKGKTYIKEENRNKLDEGVVAEITNILKENLNKIFSERKTLGKVYVDNEVYNYTIPVNMPEGNAGFHALPEGTMVDLAKHIGTIEENPYITLFCYWTNKRRDGSEIKSDIDLHAVFELKDGSYSSISYNAKNEFACHSGDFVDAENGACEFICIDRRKMPKDIKRLIVDVCSFTGEYFKDHETCHVGIEFGKEPHGENEIYDPKDVILKTELVGNSIQNIPMIFDFENNKMIYASLDNLSISGLGKNAYNTKDSTSMAIQAMLDADRIPMKDLIDINIKARGELTEDINDADLIFTTDINKLVDNNKISGKEVNLLNTVTVITPYDREMLLNIISDIDTPIIKEREIIENNREDLSKNILLSSLISKSEDISNISLDELIKRAETSLDYNKPCNNIKQNIDIEH